MNLLTKSIIMSEFSILNEDRKLKELLKDNDKKISFQQLDFSQTPSSNPSIDNAGSNHKASADLLREMLKVRGPANNPNKSKLTFASLQPQSAADPQATPEDILKIQEFFKHDPNPFTQQALDILPQYAGLISPTTPLQFKVAVDQNPEAFPEINNALPPAEPYIKPIPSAESEPDHNSVFEIMKEKVMQLDTSGIAPKDNKLDTHEAKNNASMEHIIQSTTVNTVDIKGNARGLDSTQLYAATQAKEQELYLDSKMQLKSNAIYNPQPAAPVPNLFSNQPVKNPEIEQPQFKIGNPFEAKMLFSPNPTLEIEPPSVSKPENTSVGGLGGLFDSVVEAANSATKALKPNPNQIPELAQVAQNLSASQPAAPSNNINMGVGVWDTTTKNKPKMR